MEGAAMPKVLSPLIWCSVLTGRDMRLASEERRLFGGSTGADMCRSVR